MPEEPEADIDLYDLRLGVELALEMLTDEPTLVEAEVCASWCERQTVRVQYEAERPDKGVQVPRLSTTFGVGILLVCEDQEGRRVGFGSDSGDLSPDGIRLALERAKANAVPDPDFSTLPTPAAALPGPPTFYDPQVIALYEEEITRLAIEALDGALSTLRDAGYVTDLQVCGEVCSRKERLMVGNTHGLLASETTTGLLATMLTRLAQEQSQGTGRSTATHLHDFAPSEAGVEAAQQALQARGAITPTGGEYPVVFGPQAVADLLQDLLLPALSLDTVAAGTSPFATRLGQPVAAALLTITDDGRLPGCLGSHGITGEGLPTGTTPLLDQGRLVGFLADAYHAQKLAARVGVMLPHNGMRFATNGESFGMRPGIFPTNVTLSSSQAVPLDALLAPIVDGIYVGGLWYTLPQGGLQTGEFTSTVVGPAFRIQQGTLTQPLQPGTLRLHDNMLDLLHRITGLSTTRRAMPLATRQSLVLAPEVRCSAARFVS
jgi:predicted Zn-dependent protease